jgi:hypothetical protein
MTPGREGPTAELPARVIPSVIRGPPPVGFHP